MPIHNQPRAAKPEPEKPAPAKIVEHRLVGGRGRNPIGADRSAIEALMPGMTTFLPIAPSPTGKVAAIRILCAASNLRKKLPNLKISTSCRKGATAVTVTRLA